MSTTLFPSAAPGEHAHDLSFYLDPPDQLDARAELTITPLAPLSMVSSQPGTYFLTEVAPTEHMILGMLENALGWHFDKKVRNEARKSLAEAAKKRLPRSSDLKATDWGKGKLPSSGSGYESLLVHHVRLSPKQLPLVMAYDDLWSMHLRRDDDVFHKGSRNYSAELEAYVTAFRITEADNKKKGKKKAKADFDKKEVRNRFPHYYYSPANRGHVVPDRSFVYDVITTPRLGDLLSNALSNPAAPLYLGSSDGWVDAQWTTL